MKPKQRLNTLTVLFGLSYSLFIPLEVFHQHLNNLPTRAYAPLDGSHLLQDYEVVAPEVRQLFVIFENITNQTETELSSMFDSQDHALALVSLKFWAQLIKAFFVNNNALLLGLVNQFLTKNLFHDILRSLPDDTKNHLEGLEKPNALKTDTVSVNSHGTRPNEDIGYTLKFQRFQKLHQNSPREHETDMSYESLQKWIDDYGLSSSSLRDYLETYLFAGDLLWTADMNIEDLESQSNDGSGIDLKERLAVLGANIESALTINSHTTTDDKLQDSLTTDQFFRKVNLHPKLAAHKPFKFENLDTEVEHNDEFSSVLTKRDPAARRLLDDPPDYGSIIYAFLRLDSDSQGRFSEDSDTEELDGDEVSTLQLYHRIFDNDEIVEPISALSLEESYARSKDFRQVVYDDFPAKGVLVKRESEEMEETDCVPVTWYNVLHHSIFGKHKFCHV